MALQTTVEQVVDPAPVTILALDGELDGASYERVIDAVHQIYAAGGRKLLMDLTNLQFISSSGLVAMHASMRMMRGEAPPDPEQGWEALRAIRSEVEEGSVQVNLRLCGTQEAVQKVLDRTGLGPLIPSYPDRATALAAF
jgi:anti-anti-sigma factor